MLSFFFFRERFTPTEDGGGGWPPLFFSKDISWLEPNAKVPYLYPNENSWPVVWEKHGKAQPVDTHANPVVDGLQYNTVGAAKRENENAPTQNATRVWIKHQYITWFLYWYYVFIGSEWYCLFLKVVPPDRKKSPNKKCYVCTTVPLPHHLFIVAGVVSSENWLLG